MKSLPSQGYLNERFSYDPLIGSLCWKPLTEQLKASSRARNIFNARCAGKEAGNVHKSPKGYQHVQVFLDGKNYKAHRLIWKLVTGEEPLVIDHSNHNAVDNSWLNLCNGTQGNNCKNTARREDNSSGTTGVCWDKANEKWVVQVQSEGVRFKKRFSDFGQAVQGAAAKHRELQFSSSHGAPA